MYTNAPIQTGAPGLIYRITACLSLLSLLGSDCKLKFILMSCFNKLDYLNVQLSRLSI